MYYSVNRFIETMKKCSHLLDGCGLAYGDIVFSALYVELSSFSEESNPFLFYLKKKFDTLPFSKLSSLIHKNGKVGSNKAFFPIIDAAFWTYHTKDSAFLQQIRDSEFLNRQLTKGRTAVPNRIYFGIDKYSDYFNTYCNWNFIKGQTYPYDQSSRAYRAYYITREPWEWIKHGSLSVARPLLVEKVPSGIIVCKELSRAKCTYSPYPTNDLNDLLVKYNISNPAPKALMEDLYSRTTPDIVYIDEDLILEQYDWEMKIEDIKIIQNSKKGPRKPTLITKAAYPIWIKKYQEKYQSKIKETIFDAFSYYSKNINMIIDAFVKEGYLEQIDPIHYRWTKTEREFGCWCVETFFFSGISDEPTSTSTKSRNNIPHGTFARFILNKEEKRFKNLKKSVSNYNELIFGPASSTMEAKQKKEVYLNNRANANLKPKYKRITGIFSSLFFP